MTNPNTVFIGGGTGTSNLLREAKHYTSDIHAVVNMSDDGGSSGVLRAQMGVMPPGDVRQSLSALSRDLEQACVLERRIVAGNLAGHVVGNLVLADLEVRTGCFGKAVKYAAKNLDIVGSVIPVTLVKHELLLQDGEDTIVGEHAIANHRIRSKNPRIFHNPEVTINPEAAEAIQSADKVIIAPGHHYGSRLPALAVEGIAQAFAGSSAEKILIGNLATAAGQNDGWHERDYLRSVESYIGEGQIDTLIYNVQQPDAQTRKIYETNGQQFVDVSQQGFFGTRAQLIPANLMGNLAEAPVSAGGIARSRLRHNAVELTRILFQSDSQLVAAA